MCEGVKQLVLSICQFVCQSGENLNLNIDRVKRFPKLTVALICKKVTYVYLIRSKAVLPSAFPACSLCFVFDDGAACRPVEIL